MRRWTYLTKGYAEALELEIIPLILSRRAACRWAWTEYEPLMRYQASRPLCGAGVQAHVPGVEFEGHYYAREITGGYRAVASI